MALDVAIARSPASVSTGQIVRTGSTAGVSFPTMADVNGSYTDWNQAIALYNRRTNQLQATPDPVSYLSSNVIPASALNALRTKVNNLRALLGFTPLTWTTTGSVGSKIRPIDLSDLFLALNFSSVLTANPTYRLYTRDDNPFGTQTTASDSAGGGACGTNGALGSAHRNLRYRTGVYYGLPAGYASLAAANVVLTAGLGATASGSAASGPVSFEVFRSLTDDSSWPSLWWTNNGSLLSAPTVTASTNISVTIPWTTYIANPHFSTLWVTTNEFGNVWENKGVQIAVSKVTIDWGF